MSDETHLLPLWPDQSPPPDTVAVWVLGKVVDPMRRLPIAEWERLQRSGGLYAATHPAVARGGKRPALPMPSESEDAPAQRTFNHF